MILKGSTTNSIAHAGRLANHLLNKKDNDHISVLQISGHETDDARQAMLLMHGAVTLTKGPQGLLPGVHKPRAWGIHDSRAVG